MVYLSTNVDIDDLQVIKQLSLIILYYNLCTYSNNSNDHKFGYQLIIHCYIQQLNKKQQQKIKQQNINVMTQICARFYEMLHTINVITIYLHVSQKNDNDVLRYNFNAHQPISIIFGGDIAE